MFFQTVALWGCNRDLLSAWVRAIFNTREFKENQPSSSAEPWKRADVLVNRMYKAALARRPDAGGYAYYHSQLYKGKMGEDDFVWDIVKSREFAKGAAKWCGQ